MTTIPHDPKPARPDCSTCHADAAKDFAAGAHAIGTKGSPWCTDCHGTHDILPKSDPKSHTYHLRIPETCAKCHANATITKSGRQGVLPALFYVVTVSCQ